MTIRDARWEDARELCEIYRYYVEKTAITFEYETPDLQEFQRRMAGIMEKYPYLVLEEDGEIKGYAYAGPFVGKAAYDWSCELTIYLARGVQGQGYGRRLYEALEEALGSMGIQNLYACISYPETEDDYLNKNSADFHAHLGFRLAGKFLRCGYKFERWYHMIWMEKEIGEHRRDQPPVRSYGEISGRGS
ncbi:GNAT family N-acetyltransferase [Suipraeoptans intestinalis]|uniref:GNAT family N-acetyltransferase n=1 Tax=Suipraeoptans intestinalis TaxID=2606628 RepID=UPI0023F20311|nr:GNAT family N-acetyltransferase [Suipraeoptans intestinalis]MDD7769762.1 GNAT family N-acetyltransferase [Suipraeoptans intestinalis]